MLIDNDVRHTLIIHGYLYIPALIMVPVDFQWTVNLLLIKLPCCQRAVPIRLYNGDGLDYR